MLRAHQSGVHQVTVASCPELFKGLEKCLGKGWTGGLVVWLSPAVRLLGLCAHFEK